MNRFCCVVLALAACAVPGTASAAVISFANPTRAFGDCPSPSPTGTSRGTLAWYEEAGVQLRISQPFTNINGVTCDTTAAPFHGLLPVIDDPPFNPVSLFAWDNGTMDVDSLSGDAIRRLRIEFVDRRPPNVAGCDSVWIGPVRICGSFSGDVNFAAAGYADGLTSFRVFFPHDDWDSRVRIQEIEVPEPLTGVLLGAGLAATAVFRRGRKGASAR